MRTQLDYILCCGFGDRHSYLLPFCTSIVQKLVFFMFTLSLIDSHHSSVQFFTFSEIAAKALPNKAPSEPELAESTSSYPEGRQ